MTHDYAHSLRRLLRFPPVEDVTTFLDCARLLRKDPTRPFPEPKTQQLLQRRRGAGAAGGRGGTAPPPGAGGYVPGGGTPRSRAGAAPARRSATAQAANALSGIGAVLGGVRDRLAQPQQSVSAPQGPGSLFDDAFGPPRPPQPPSVAPARGMTMAEQLSHARKVQYNMAGHLERIVRSLEQAVWASSPAQDAASQGSASAGGGARGDGGEGGAGAAREEEGGAGQEEEGAASADARDDAVMRAVAELKQVKEVLRGRLEERDCFWEGQEVNTPVEPAHGVHPRPQAAQGQARNASQPDDRVTGPSVFATAEGAL